MKPPLIERADLQSRHQRALYGALTMLFWLFWMYLWLPLLALLAWGLGIEQAYKYMVVLGGYREVVRLIGLYLLVIGLLGGSLVSWAAYNIIRFRGVEHRVSAPPVSVADVARHFSLDPAHLARWQGGRRLHVTHGPDGNVAQVAVHPEL